MGRLIMGSAIPAIQFGYLTLTNDVDDKILIKANKITAIEHYESDGNAPFQTVIYVGDEDSFQVVQSVEQILSQLEGVHPSLR
jgi:hypothetical protein